MKKLNKAIKIAAEIHTGSKGGKREPAIMHPIRVMIKMDDQVSRTVAIARCKPPADGAYIALGWTFQPADRCTGGIRTGQRRGRSSDHCGR